ncbi:hypothetical protein ACLK1T_24115 [Escherichia coli]
MDCAFHLYGDECGDASPHVSGLNQTLQHYSTEHNSIAETFNLSVWPLIAVLLVITFWVVMKS